MLTIITFFIILGLLVFVHEFGHFLVAKRMGVKVEEFGFGFPPRLIGIKKGETIYSLNLIPFGGFVKIKGETGEFKEDPDSFANKSVGQRFLILSSGVAMNFLLTMVLLSFGFSIGIPQVLDTHPGAKIRDEKIQIISVFKNSPAEREGLEIGDVILSIDNRKFEDIKEMQDYIDKKTGEKIEVKIRRGKEEKIFELIPEVYKDRIFLPKEVREERGVMGVGLVRTGVVSYPFYRAIWEGIKTTILLTYQILVTFYFILKYLILEKILIAEVAGPVGIAVLTGKVVQLGFIYVLQFTALLSINLAIINFLPFPALDGGRVLFLGIEKIRGKPVNRKIENLVHSIGFALLMLLIVLITYRDIIRLTTKFWERIGRMMGG